MAQLIACRDCGERISRDAWKCPHCGARARRALTFWRVFALLMVAAVGFQIGLCQRWLG